MGVAIILIIHKLEKLHNAFGIFLCKDGATFYFTDVAATLLF